MARGFWYHSAISSFSYELCVKVVQSYSKAERPGVSLGFFKFFLILVHFSHVNLNLTG